MTLAVGARVDRYTIEAPIAEGGMGRVYRAHDERLDRRVALKIVSAPAGDASEGEAKKRLVREARAASKLDHPNVVSVFDVGETAEGPFIVMELVPGRSLRELIDDGSLSAADRVRVLRDVALALGAAHDAGIVHRDVKPENVMVRPDGRVKVLDFGIARAASRPLDESATTGLDLTALTQDGAKLGTPRYMAPEQIRGGPVDGRSDQFGWGVTAFELVEGRPPFRGPDAVSVMAAVLSDPAPASSAAPPAVAAVIARSLEKDPAKRFASMHEVAAALLQPVGPAPVSAPPPATPSRPPAAAGPAPQLSRRYSSDELEEIFDRALAVQRTGYSYADVAGAAREIGVDPRQLDRAMAQLERRGAVEPRPELQQRSLRGLWRHVGIWLAVSMGLFFLNVFDRSPEWWFQYTMISWGIGVGIHAVVALTRGPPERKPLKRRSRDPDLERDAVRVATWLEGPRVRIADATGGSADVDAEDEAAAAEASSRRGNRQRR